MPSTTRSAWKGAAGWAVFYAIAFAWSFTTFAGLYPSQTFRVVDLAVVTAAIGVFWHWFGMIPCRLWNYQFGHSWTLLLVEKLAIAIAPLWFLAFPVFLPDTFIRVLGTRDAVFAFALWVVMLDLGGNRSAQRYDLVEGRAEITFQNLGLGYPPRSKTATLLVFAATYLVPTAMLLSI